MLEVRFAVIPSPIASVDTRDRAVALARVLPADRAGDLTLLLSEAVTRVAVRTREWLAGPGSLDRYPIEVTISLSDATVRAEVHPSAIAPPIADGGSVEEALQRAVFDAVATRWGEDPSGMVWFELSQAE
jgi:hypothetical protein